MTPHVTAAVRTRARAEARCQRALLQYRDAREHYVRWPHRTPADARIALVWAVTARMRWATLAELLAADAVLEVAA